MEAATAATVLGDFSNAGFNHRGIQSRFFQRDGEYWVNADGPDGKPADFHVKYTFGVDPFAFAPAHPSEKALLQRFARIGVGAGKPFDETELSPEINAALDVA